LKVDELEKELAAAGETLNKTTSMSILLETTFGDLVIDLDIDGSPALSKNILKLAKARYYTNTLVYNVVPGRYCQMGGELFGLHYRVFVLYLLFTSHNAPIYLYSKIHEAMDPEAHPYTVSWTPQKPPRT
jgi:hypothetical protein